MNGKTIFAVYASLGLLTLGLALVTPWYLAVSVICFAASYDVAIKSQKVQTDLAERLIKLEQQAVDTSRDLKKMSDDLQVSINRVNMSIGVRK